MPSETVLLTFVQKIESLRESKQYNQVNYTKREHVTGDHGINHRNKRSSQSNSSSKKHQKKPTSRYRKHQNRLFSVIVSNDAEWNACQYQNVRNEENRLGRSMNL